MNDAAGVNNGVGTKQPSDVRPDISGSETEGPTGIKGADTAGRSRLIEVSFPEKLTPFVWLAMAMGAVLVAVAVSGFVFSWQLNAHGSVLLGAGVAIILAAFGGQATVQGKIYVLAGVAAIAFILVAILEQRRSSDQNHYMNMENIKYKQYVRGNIHEVPGMVSTVLLKFARNVLGTTDIYGKQYSFVVFHDEATEAEYASLTLELRDVDAPISIAIPASCITRSFGHEPLDWEMRKVEDVYEVLDRRHQFRVVGRWGGERPEPCNIRETRIEVPSLTFGIARAFAQSAPIVNVGALPLDLQWLSRDLTSDDTEIRRSARDAISLTSVDQLPELLKLAKDERDIYRVKLGVAVALAEMLRRDKQQGALIRHVLKDEDRELLLDFAGDHDRTVRIYATEFLYDLGDPGVTRLAIPRAAETEDDDARYNWLFVSQDGWWRLDKRSRNRLEADLAVASARSGAKTRNLISEFFGNPR